MLTNPNPNEAQTSSPCAEYKDDPITEKIVMSLQSVQTALEKEVQHFGQIGWETVFLSDDLSLTSNLPEEVVSADTKSDEASSFDVLHIDGNEQGGSQTRPMHPIELNENVHNSKSKARDVLAMMKSEECQGLESILTRRGYLKEVPGSTLRSLQDECMEMEMELEGLFKQKIEAEVEYVTLARTNQRLHVAAEDQILLLQKQTYLAKEQIHLLQKLGDAERKAILLKSQMNGLEASCEELLATEQILTMQTRVCEQTCYFFLQLILLLVSFLLFLLQLFPRSFRVVPT